MSFYSFCRDRTPRKSLVYYYNFAMLSSNNNFKKF